MITRSVILLDQTRVKECLTLLAEAISVSCVFLSNICNYIFGIKEVPVEQQSCFSHKFDDRMSSILEIHT